MPAIDKYIGNYNEMHQYIGNNIDVIKLYKDVVQNNDNLINALNASGFGQQDRELLIQDLEAVEGYLSQCSEIMENDVEVVPLGGPPAQETKLLKQSSINVIGGYPVQEFIRMSSFYSNYKDIGKVLVAPGQRFEGVSGASFQVPTRINMLLGEMSDAIKNIAGLDNEYKRISGDLLVCFADKTDALNKGDINLEVKTIDRRLSFLVEGGIKKEISEYISDLIRSRDYIVNLNDQQKEQAFKSINSLQKKEIKYLKKSLKKIYGKSSNNSEKENLDLVLNYLMKAKDKVEKKAKDLANQKKRQKQLGRLSKPIKQKPKKKNSKKEVQPFNLKHKVASSKTTREKVQQGVREVFYNSKKPVERVINDEINKIRLPKELIEKIFSSFSKDNDKEALVKTKLTASVIQKNTNKLSEKLRDQPVNKAIIFRVVKSDLQRIISEYNLNLQTVKQEYRRCLLEEVALRREKKGANSFSKEEIKDILLTVQSSLIACLADKIIADKAPVQSSQIDDYWSRL